MKEILSETFGSRLTEYNEINGSMPLYLKSQRSFYEVMIGETRFVLVMTDEAERFNIAVLKKHLTKYYEVFNAYIVYGFGKITTFQRKSLVENEISFISGNGQIYLPFLGAFFGKCQAKKIETVGKRFSPATQALILLMIYYDGEMSKAESANRLELTPMSVSRASEDLKALGVISERRKGTELLIARMGTRTEAYRKVENYLINPVWKTVYINKGDLTEGLIAGEYALSKRSDFGYPKYFEYAVSKKDYAGYGYREYDPDIDMGLDLIRIQKWKYSPLLFADKDKIDPISLICSFQGEDDERIHKCLGDIEEEIEAWLQMKN